MLNERIETAFNEQIAAELYSAYIYLSMAAYCEDENLGGFAHWLQLQADEEVDHAMRLFNFILERGGQVELLPIDKPPKDFNSPLDVFEKALDHERKITGKIENLYQLALEEEDYAAQVFLQWFIDEQVEEEASAEEIVEKLKMVGDKKHVLLSIDRDLGQREVDEE
ncbi:MAG: ferritin [Candidatus Bipolaricaulota bacterium]